MALNFAVFDTVSAANEGAELHLTVPGSGELAYLDAGNKNPKKPCIIKLLGAKSDKNTQIQQEYQRKQRDRKVGEAPANQERDRLLNMVAGLTVGWSNIPDDDGKELPFSHENAVTLYSKYEEIFEQALQFILRKENFIKS
jgi:hypothetical protein